MLRERVPEPLWRHVEGDAPLGVDLRLHIDRHGAGEDEAVGERHVGVAGRHHEAARRRQRQDERVQAAARPVREEEGAVGAPGLCGELLGRGETPGTLAGVLESRCEGQIDIQRRAQRLPQPRRRAASALVAGHVERHVIAVAVEQQAVEDRGAALPRVSAIGRAARAAGRARSAAAGVACL